MDNYTIERIAERCAEEIDWRVEGKSDDSFNELVANISDAIRRFLYSSGE